MKTRSFSFFRILCLTLLLGAILLLTGCDGVTTVFEANFNSDTVGSNPASTQANGTISLEPGAGTIRVVSAPAPTLPENKWVSITHPTRISPQTTMRANFSNFHGLGNYGFWASLYIPTGTEKVTVQFEPYGRDTYSDFLHLDFMPEGDVQINHGSIRFGRFPRDREFILSVNLSIADATTTAHITLLGSGASGSTDVNVASTSLSLARQFGAVRFWMGYEWQGSFFVDNILVTYKAP